MTVRRKTGRGKAPLPRAPAKPTGAPRAIARRARRRWVLAVIVGVGVSVYLVRDEVVASSSPPVRPADLDLLDPFVRRLVEKHVRRVEEDPSARNHATLGLVYEANGMWQEAERSFAIACELDGGDALWRLHRGIVLVNLGEFHAAENAFREALERDEGSAAAHHRLADVLSSTGTLDEALVHYRAAVELAPDRPEGRTGLGTALFRRGELEEASTELARAVELDPGYRSAHYQLGLTYRELGRAEDAERELALGVEARKEYIPDALDESMRSFQVGYSALRRGARSLLESGRWSEGIAVLEALRRQRPADAYVLNDLAIAYLRGGDARRAHELLLEAKQIDEREHTTWMSLAAWGLETGELDQALAHADRAVELAGQMGAPHVVRGNVLAKKGRYTEALATLQKAVQLDPRNPDAHHALARVNAHLGRHEEARAILLTATSLDPRRWQAILDLAQVHALLGQTEEAAKALASAQELAPGHPLVAGMARELDRLAAGRR